MTTEEAAKELGLSVIRVREFCQAGRLGRKVGRQWIITREELEEFKRVPRPPGNPHKGQGDVMG